MAQHMRRAYPRLTRWKIRSVARFRAVLKPRPRIIFIHIPKAAGTSITTYLRVCIGPHSRGKSIGMSEIPFEERRPQSRIDFARQARLVHGHMDWRTVEQIDPDKAFTFTFLREPRERLISHYNILPLLTETLADNRLKLVAKVTHGRPPAEVARSRDPIILAHIDNYMVRTLAGSVHDYPIARPDWPKLVDRALRNLGSLDFVGFQESFDSDFSALLERLNLPQTRDFAPLNRRPQKQELDVDPAFYEWDQKLVDAFRGHHPWHAPAPELMFSA